MSTRIKEGLPSIPGTLETEWKTNIFYLCETPTVQDAAGLSTGTASEIFGALRKRKNRF